MTCTVNESFMAVTRDKLRRKFGDGTIGVELTDDQLSDCINDAVTWFAKYMRIGRNKSTTINLVTNDSMYEMPDDCVSVTRVITNARPLEVPSVSMEWVNPNLSRLPGRRSDGGLAGIVQDQQYMSMGNRVLGNALVFRWIEHDRKLVLHRVQAGDTFATVEYVSSDFNSDQLKPEHHGILFRRAYAEACEVLGQIRSKYSDWPTASGSVSMNGDTLLSNADSMRLTLDEEIKKLQPPPSFIRG